MTGRQLAPAEEVIERAVLFHQDDDVLNARGAHHAHKEAEGNPHDGIAGGDAAGSATQISWV